MAAPKNLANLRVLVVEDEPLVSMFIEEMLADLGCHAVGPFGTLTEALEAGRRDDYDVAIVDLNLGGKSAEPLIEALAERKIPFAIATGARLHDEDRPDNVVLNKPFRFEQFSAALAELASLASAGRD